MIKQLNMVRNIEKNILALKLSTLLVDVAELVSGVEKTDFIRIKKDYKKCLTKKKKCDIIVSEREVNIMLTIEEILEIMGTNPDEVIECEDGFIMTFGNIEDDEKTT